MEIKKVMEEALAVSFPKRGSQDVSKELDFRRFLEEANMNLKGTSPAISQTPLSDVQGDLICPPPLLSEISPILEVSDQVKSQGIEAFEETLKILEQYKQALGNPEIPLKKIDPIINTLSQELENLNRLCAQLAPSDPLKKIITEAGIVSAVEVEKFRRGEYV